MALDSDMREQLRASADWIEVDPIGGFETVVRRGRVRRFARALASAASVALIAVGIIAALTAEPGNPTFAGRDRGPILVAAGETNGHRWELVALRDGDRWCGRIRGPGAPLRFHECGDLREDAVNKTLDEPWPRTWFLYGTVFRGITALEIDFHLGERVRIEPIDVGLSVNFFIAIPPEGAPRESPYVTAFADDGAIVFSELGDGAPAADAPERLLAQGSINGETWRYYAYPAGGSFCVRLERSPFRDSGGGCGFPVPDQEAIGFGTDGTFVDGPVRSDILRIEIHTRRGEPVSIETIPFPGYDIRFYIGRIDGRSITAIIGFDRDGREVARLEDP